MTALRRYADWRAWLRHLARASLHAGSGALLSGAGTNTAEALAPVLLRDVGLDLRQMLAVFAAAAFLAALRELHAATAPAP